MNFLLQIPHKSSVAFRTSINSKFSADVDQTQTSSFEHNILQTQMIQTENGHSQYVSDFDIRSTHGPCHVPRARHHRELEKASQHY